MSERAEELRREAARIEQEEKLQEAKESGKPFCPSCGSQSFTIGAWATVTQVWNAAEESGSDNEWGAYESGDHTDEWAYANCRECGEECTGVLEKAGHQFYDDPKPKAKQVEKETT